MCSLAVAEDIHTVVTPAPRVLKRNQFRAQRGCCKMCQGIPKLHQNTGRGDGGEQTETKAGAILLGKMAHWSLLLRPPATSSSGQGNRKGKILLCR